jgi:hypothetical protein
MVWLNLHRDFDPDPRGLEANELDVVGQLLPVRMVIAFLFFKRVFTRSLPMDQAHGLIIGEYATRGKSFLSDFSVATGCHRFCCGSGSTLEIESEK